MSTRTMNLQPDPATQQLLDQVVAADLPPTHTLSPAAARQMMIDGGKVTDFEPPAVANVFERTLPGPGGDIPVRCYYPKGVATRPLPVLLYFHGGGFVIGDLDTHDSLCRYLCNGAGTLVVAVHYRLAPEHRYPAAVEDALAAFDWHRRHAADIDGDPGCLAVAGDSAGGTLAAILGQHARSQGTDALRGQLLFYPALDHGGGYSSLVEHAQTHPISKPVLDWFWDHYFGPDLPAGSPARLSPLASPMRIDDFAGLAPAFVLTAGLDPLRDEGAVYAQRLAEAGVETTYYCVMGAIHGFLRMGKVMTTVDESLAAAARFLKQRVAQTTH